MSRKFKLRRVVENVSSWDVTRPGSKQRQAINVVWLDCGHIVEVEYWPYPNHYQIGDKCRCYQCPKGMPTMTPKEWHQEHLDHVKYLSLNPTLEPLE